MGVLGPHYTNTPVHSRTPPYNLSTLRLPLPSMVCSARLVFICHVFGQTKYSLLSPLRIRPASTNCPCSPDLSVEPRVPLEAATCRREGPDEKPRKEVGVRPYCSHPRQYVIRPVSGLDAHDMNYSSSRSSLLSAIPNAGAPWPRFACHSHRFDSHCSLDCDCD
jgi:hypothetical protein